MSDNWYQIENADEIPSPALLVYPERIRENIRNMVELTGDSARLRPHVKTHKMAEVIKLQVAAGIVKF
ncbi:MAG: D-serine deaminase-like pyridoxal phosphate-dependent protein, partial [Candidatus Binatia bacterium]